MMTSSTTATTPPMTNHSLWLRRTGKDSVYLFTGLPLAVAGFSVLVTSLATGAALLITLAGLPILVLTCVLARQSARLERRRIAWVSGRPADEPAHRSRTRRGIGGLFDAVRDPQAIRDVVHGITVLAVSSVTWTIAVAWAAVAPITVVWLFSGDDARAGGRRIPDWLGIDSHAGRTWLYLTAAVVCTVTLPLIIRGLTALQVGYGRFLLTHEKQRPA